MAKEEEVEFAGTITETLPNALFRVLLDIDKEIIAHLAGRIHKNKIRISKGDRVVVAMPPYGITRGRIIYREK